MVKIRLQRVGKRNRPHYRIVVADSRRAVKGKTNKILGFYDPLKKSFDMKIEDVEKWLAVGAQMSPRVKSLVELYKKSTKEVVES